MRGCKTNPPKDDPLYDFAKKLYEQKGFNVAAVAVANKMARIAHAIITRNRSYNA